MTDPYFKQKEALNWLQIVLFERFGQKLNLCFTDGNVIMRHETFSEGSIIFSNLIEDFRVGNSNPIPCGSYDPSVDGLTSPTNLPIPIPGCSNLNDGLLKKNEHQLIVNYDILGLTYWMLCRIEEVDSKKLDTHGRFPATSSHAYQNNYLHRPIVDEWLNILGQLITNTWPSLNIRNHKFNMKLSHDVDQPGAYAFKSWNKILRLMAGHLIKRRDLKQFILTPLVKINSLNKISRLDPYNTFDWLMDISEKYQHRSAFYFISGNTSAKYDADYKIESRQIRNLIKKIHARGHEIGLHPSYNTYLNPQQLKSESEHLKRICSDEKINQSSFGGRMHYLRWSTPETLNSWNNADMAYDSTLGYSDVAGFRCGTCFEYPGFDIKEKRVLAIRVRPLIAMESTIIDKVYMGLGDSPAALAKFLELKKMCRSVNGNFTLLWHNSYFQSRGLKKMYEDIIKN